MNRKLRNMEIILNIGSIILFLAGIGLLFTREIDTNSVKAICSTIVSVFLIVFSFVSQIVLKTKSSNQVSHYLGCVLLIATFIFAIAVDLFSLGNDIIDLSIAAVYLLIIILSILTVVRFKHYSLLHLTFVALILCILHIITQCDLNYRLVFIIAGLVILVATFVKNEKVSGFAVTHSFIFVLLCLLFTFSYELSYQTALFAMNMIIVFRALYKDKNPLCELIALGFIVTSLISYGIILGEAYDTTVAVVVISFVTGILELLVNYYHVIDGKVNKVFYKTVFLLTYIILGLIVIDDSETILLPITLFMFLSSFGSTVLLKAESDNAIACKALVFVYALLLNLDKFVFEIKSITYVYIISLVCIFMYIVFKNESVKRTASIISFLLTLPLVVLTKDVNTLLYVASSLMILLNVFVYASNESQIDNNLKSVLMSVDCYALLAITTNSVVPITYLISSIVLIIITYMNKDNFVRYAVSLFFLFFTLKGCVNTSVANFSSAGEISIILNSVIFFLIISLFVFNCISKKHNQDILLSIFVGLALLVLLVDYNSLVVILYTLFVSICLLVIGVVKKEFKGLYIIGIVFSILSLISTLSYIKGLPTVVYMIILGLALIIIISILIYKYQNSPEKIIDDVKTSVIDMSNDTKFCSECGQKIDEKDDYCPECGFNLKGGNTYCGNCGAKIRKGEKFCEKCGEKLN